MILRICWKRGGEKTTQPLSRIVLSCLVSCACDLIDVVLFGAEEKKLVSQSVNPWASVVKRRKRRKSTVEWYAKTEGKGEAAAAEEETRDLDHLHFPFIWRNELRVSPASFEA